MLAPPPALAAGGWAPAALRRQLSSLVTYAAWGAEHSAGSGQPLRLRRADHALVDALSSQATWTALERAVRRVCQRSGGGDGLANDLLAAVSVTLTLQRTMIDDLSPESAKGGSLSGTASVDDLRERGAEHFRARRFDKAAASWDAALTMACESGLKSPNSTASSAIVEPAARAQVSACSSAVTLGMATSMEPLEEEVYDEDYLRAPGDRAEAAPGSASASAWPTWDLRATNFAASAGESEGGPLSPSAVESNVGAAAREDREDESELLGLSSHALAEVSSHAAATELQPAEVSTAPGLKGAAGPGRVSWASGAARSRSGRPSSSRGAGAGAGAERVPSWEREVGGAAEALPPSPAPRALGNRRAAAAAAASGQGDDAAGRAGDAAGTSGTVRAASPPAARLQVSRRGPPAVDRARQHQAMARLSLGSPRRNTTTPMSRSAASSPSQAAPQNPSRGSSRGRPK